MVLSQSRSGINVTTHSKLPGLKVLIVDDNPLYRLAFEKQVMVVNDLHNVETARSMEDAISIIGEDYYIPDVLFLDVNMPLNSGFDFLDYLENSESIILSASKIVLMTTPSYVEDENRAKEYERHCSFKYKPYTTNELQNLFEKVAENRTALTSYQ